MEHASQDMIVQLLPSMILGLAWAYPVYKTCKKRGVSPWIWTVLMVIPVIGLIALPVFWTVTVMSILDRLNATPQAEGVWK